MDNFKLANEQLNTEDVARYMGLTVKNHNVSCPFHSDRTPSMKLYKTSFFCFGCGATGDTITLASKMLNVSPCEALERLNRVFNLGLELGKPISRRIIREQKAIRQERRNYREWYSIATSELSDYIRWCCSIYYDELISKESRLLAKTEVLRIESLQDRMFEVEPEEAYKTYREEVEKIDRRLQRKKELEEYCAGSRKEFPMGSSD